MKQRPVCTGVIEERRGMYRTMLFCPCGWRGTAYHRNALARVSVAKAMANKHLKEKTA